MTNAVPNSSADAPSDHEGLEATVIASLPNGLFRLRLATGREVIAHPAQDMRMAFVRLLAGDVVRVDLSPFDADKARIRQLLRQQHVRTANRNPLRSNNPQNSENPS